MPIRSGLIVAIKIIMLALGFNAALVMLTIAGAVDMPGLSKVVGLSATCLVFVPILLIFWGAAWIVDILTPGSQETIPQSAIYLEDLQSIAFSAVGAYIIFDAIRGSVFFLALIQNKDLLPSISIPGSPLNPLIGWIVGIYLLIGAPGLRQWLGSLRRAGNERREQG